MKMLKLLAVLFLSCSGFYAAAQLSTGNGGLTVKNNGHIHVQGLDLRPSADLEIKNTSITKSNAPLAFGNRNSISRVYTFTAPLTFSGNIRINYRDGELNGNIASRLVLVYRSNATLGLTTSGSSMADPAAKTVQDVFTGITIADLSAVEPAAPSALTYTTPNVFTKDTAITDLTPSISGGAVTSWSISPVLPAGLSFDTATGVISGTPTVLSVATDYTVTATNSSGSTTFTMSMAIIDPAPEITLVDVPANGTYIANQELSFRISFDKNLLVTGTPRLVLTVGSVSRYANYQPGSSTANVLAFTYTVQAGDLDVDGITVDALQLNGGTIKGTSGGDAALVLNNLPPTTSVLVDGVAPVITVANIGLSGATGAAGMYKIGDVVTASWNNTATGDHNTDIGTVTVDFSAFGGSTAVTAMDDNGTWTATYAVTSGNYGGSNKNISINAADQAGNVSTVAGQNNVSLDDSAPLAPSEPDLDADSDSGRSKTDNITKITQPVFTGTAETGATVNLYSGNTRIGTGIATNGNWSIKSDSLADGTYAITATATDLAGNVSLPSGALTVTIITTAPAAPTISLRASSDTGISASDLITNVKNPAFEGTCPYDTRPFLFEDSMNSGSISTPGNTLRGVTIHPETSGKWIITSTTLQDGAHPIRAVVEDVAGNFSLPSPILMVTIDTQAPSAPSISGLTATSDTGISDTDQLTNNTTPTLTGTAEGGGTVTIYNGSSNIGIGTAAGGNWEITTMALAEGNHILTVTATDVAGNISVISAGFHITIDSTVPTLSAVNLVSNHAVPTLARVGNEVVLTFTSSEVIIPAVTIATHSVTAVNTGGNNWKATYTLTSTDAEGAVAYAIAFADKAGNAGTTVTTGVGGVIFDRAAPVVPRDLIATFSDTQNALSWTANIDADLIAYKVYGGISPNPTNLLATVLRPTTTYNHTGLINGTTYYYRITAVDQAGNESAYSSEVSAIPRAPQTITFTDITSTYGNADFDAGATATSGLSVYYSSDNQAVATIVDGKIHIVGAGTAHITAGQPGNQFYTPAIDQQRTLTVKQRLLTVTATATDKVYDGNITATVALNDDRVPSDALTVTHAAAAFDDKHVGENKLVTITGINISGPDAGNYSFNLKASSTANITHRSLELTVKSSPSITKVYDQTNKASLVPSHYVLTSVVSGDEVSVTGTATYDNADVGTGKTITVGSFVLAGSASADYSLSTLTATTSGTITQKALTLTLNSTPAITKVYDQTNRATLAAGNYTITGVESGDAVSVSGTASYDNANVGTGKTITVGSFVLAGSASANYSVPTGTLTTSGAITQKALTLTLNSTPAITKVYDQTNTATLATGNYTLTGVEAGDAVSVSGTATYDNANVGTNKTVTLGSFALGGSASANYSLSTVMATTTGAITQKALTLTLNNIPLITKVYDRTTIATLNDTNFTLSGVENNDGVTVTGVASYADANVGVGKTISVNSFALAGAAASNYSLSTTMATTTGNITARPITAVLLATPAITKVYDGNANASLVAANYTLTDIQTGDMVTVGGAASYANPQVGIGKIVTANNLLLAGIDRDNYNLINSSATTTGSITPASLTVTADSKTKVFGSANPVLTASYSGFVNGENSTVLITQPTLTTTATTLSPIGNYPISASAAVASNYAISYVPGTIAVSARPITVTATAKSKVYGDADPTLTYTYTGTLVGSDSFSGSLTRAMGENVGSYAINRGTLDLGNNYSINYVGANMAIGKAVLTITANNAVMCQGNNLPIFGVSYNGFKFSDNEASLGTKPTAGTTANRNSAAGNYVLTANGAVSGNYSFTYVNGQLTINALPVVAISSNNGLSVSKGATVQLTATGGTSYSWSNASGVISGQNTAVLTVRPSQTTTYTVTATNANGCSQIRSVTIEVVEDYMMVSGTNILTPNGDGKNDYLIIRNIDMYPNSEIKIFDIAGRLVYSKKAYDNSWDGTFNGSPLAKGTYYYIIDFADGKAKRKGFVSIVRD